MTQKQIEACAEEIVYDEIASTGYLDNPPQADRNEVLQQHRSDIAAVIARHLAAAKKEQEWPRTNLGKLLNVMVQEIGAMSPHAFKSIHVTTAIDDADRIADRLERINNENT